MDAAPPSTPVGPASNLESHAVLSAWPRSAQWVTAFLLGVATTLLAIQILGHSRWAARPSDPYRPDLNRAERAELLQLPGVGPSRAGRIQDYRREHGDFRSVNELAEVRGFGPATLERLTPWVRVQTDESEVRSDADPSTPSSAKHSTPAASPKRPSKKLASLAGPVQLNRATAEELQRVPGIGPKTSQRILDERRKAPFKSVDELRRVSGIGQKTLEKLRPYLTVDRDELPVVTVK